MKRGETNVESGPQHEIYNIKKDDVCQRIPFYIHQGGSNDNFADGHAKWERVEQTWQQWHHDHTVLPGDPIACLDHTKQKAP